VNHFHRPFNPVATRRRPGIPHGQVAGNFLLALCGVVLLTASAFATPTEEITSAVAVNGVSDIYQARPTQFLKAFTAVALRTQPRNLPEYVVAAINLRSDLSPNIVAVAVNAAVKRWEAKPEALCAIIERIVKEAITANPEAAVSIANAAISASPELRRCIVAAAISAKPDEKNAIVQATDEKTLPLAFISFSAFDSSGFTFNATPLNPANIWDLGNAGNVNSPEQPPPH
jgi:hypothetical protein